MIDGKSDQQFGGVIGRFRSESTPWWPERVAPPPGSPNVVFIVFDDVGFSDFRCYGSEIETPNLDRLAARGLRYTNFHTTALCSPTRACLLTGRNHHSVGMATLSNFDTGFPGSRGRISRNAGTLAEMVRAQGYNTFAIGKWHLTPMTETTPAGPFEQWPLQRGFDRFYGFLDGETNQWRPDLAEDNHRIDPPERDGYHLTEDLVDHAITLVRDQKSIAPEKPFFLYLCFGACHAPHHVARRYIEKYEPVFAKGWDRTREDRLARQKEMGIVPPETQLPPRNEHVKPWEDLSDDAKRLFVRLQAAYAGMLDHTEENIGRLLGFLDTMGQADNTLTFVISDNGASQEGSPLGTVNAVRYFNAVRDELDYNLAHIDEIGESHLNNNYPLGWAMAGNTPLKRYKQNTHGGGVRDPLIVHWPAGIRDGGGIRRQFHHVVDVCPTVLDVLGIAPPASINGVAQQAIEGTSIAYTFADPGAPPAKSTQYFEMLGHRGIWHEGWKAVAWHPIGRPADDDQWELYHLDEDFNESHDLAGERPEKLREMVERWWAEAGKYRVLPLADQLGMLRASDPSLVRSRYVYYPGLTHIPAAAAPDTRNRSYSITAEVEIPDGGAEGVIIAQGDSCAGFSLYMRDGRLVHDYNFVGTHYVLTSDREVPAGASTLRFEVTTTGPGQGNGALYVNGEQTGDVAMPQLLRTMIFGGLDVGRDANEPVSDYAAPFEFTGTIKRVTIDLADDQLVDRAATARAELARQ